jgi:hypothetical protein
MDPNKELKMKYFLLLLILASPVMAKIITSDPNFVPIVAYDPAKVIESPSDPNNVRFIVYIEISKQQYRAMQYMDYTMIDMFHRTMFRNVWNRIISLARAKWSKRFTIEQLEAKE